MTTDTHNELLSRLNLMEQVIQEGRKTTMYYGWMFVLWGVGYMVAIGWVYLLPKPMLAWPVVMPLTALVGGLTAARKRRGQADTSKSRALGAIWIATGCTIMVFAFGPMVSQHGWSNPQAMMAGIEVMLGLANVASSLVLRWKLQTAVGIMWWVCGTASFYVSSESLLPVLMVGTLIGNFGFGLYLMYLEAQARQQVVHG